MSILHAYRATFDGKDRLGRAAILAQSRDDAMLQLTFQLVAHGIPVVGNRIEIKEQDESFAGVILMDTGDKEKGSYP